MPTASSARGTYRAGGGRFARPLDLPPARALSRSTPNLSSNKRQRRRQTSDSPSPLRHDCGITAPGIYSFRARPVPSFVLDPVLPSHARNQYRSQFSEQRPPYGVDGDTGRDVPFYPPSLHPQSPEMQTRIQRLRDTRKLYRSPASRRAAAGSVDDLLKNTRPARDPCSAVHHARPFRERYGTLSSSVPAHLHHLHRQRSRSSTKDASVGSSDSLYFVEPYTRCQSTMALLEQPLTEATQTEGMSTDSLNASTRSMPGLHVGVGTEVGTKEMGIETDLMFGEGIGKSKVRSRERKPDTVREAKKKARISSSNRRAATVEKSISKLKTGQNRGNEQKANPKHSVDHGGKIHKTLGTTRAGRGEGTDLIDGDIIGMNVNESKMNKTKDKKYDGRGNINGEISRERDRGRSPVDNRDEVDRGGQSEDEIRRGDARDYKMDQNPAHDGSDVERQWAQETLVNQKDLPNGDESFYLMKENVRDVNANMSKSYPDFRSPSRTSNFGEISTIFETDRETDAAENTGFQLSGLRRVPKRVSDHQPISLESSEQAVHEPNKSGDQDEETIAESHVSSSEARSSILDSDADVLPREMPTDPADLRHVEKRRSSLLKVATDDAEQDSLSEYYLFPGEQSTASGVTNTPVGPLNDRVSTWFHKNIFYQSIPIDGGAEILTPGDENGQGIRVASVQIAITRVVHNPNFHVEPPDQPMIVSTLTYPIRQLYPLPMSNHFHPVVTKDKDRHGVESCPSRVIYEVDKQGDHHPLSMKWTVAKADEPQNTQSKPVTTKCCLKSKRFTEKSNPAPEQMQQNRRNHPVEDRPARQLVEPKAFHNRLYQEQVSSDTQEWPKEKANEKSRTSQAEPVPATSNSECLKRPYEFSPRQASPLPSERKNNSSNRPNFDRPINQQPNEVQKKPRSPRPDSLNLVPNYESVYLKSSRQSALDFWRQREAGNRPMVAPSTSKRNALSTSVGASYQQRRNF